MRTNTHTHDEQLLQERGIMIIRIEGRYYPLRMRTTAPGVRELESHPTFTWSFEDTYGIPPALGPRHTEGAVSFTRRAAAVEFCLRHLENLELLFHYRCSDTIVTQTDHPEWVAWYVAETERLMRSKVFLSEWLGMVRASVYDGLGERVEVTVADCTEAVMQLYDLVVERLQQPAQAS